MSKAELHEAFVCYRHFAPFTAFGCLKPLLEGWRFFNPTWRDFFWVWLLCVCVLQVLRDTSNVATTT